MAGALIVGGAGFVGCHLARALVSRGDEVHVLIRPASDASRLAAISDQLSTYRADTRDERAIAEVLNKARPERVYYLARARREGLSPLEEAGQLVDSSIGELVKFLKATAKANVAPAVFVRAGTIAEYGAAPLPNDEAARERPLTAYGACVVAGTHLLAALAPSLPFRIANARLALIYGPLQSTEFLVPLILERCLAGQPVTIDDPESSRDFLYIDDLVEGMILLGEKDVGAADPINFGTGRAITMRRVAEVIVTAAGVSPSLIQYGKPNPNAGARHLCLTTDLAERLVGWRAKVPFEEGIGRMLTSILGDSSSMAR